jgi:hypothetical protein
MCGPYLGHESNVRGRGHPCPRLFNLPTHSARKAVFMKTRCIAAIFVLGMLFAVPLPVWAGAKCKVLHNFGASGDGTLPWDSPILNNQGNLYGVTLTGGTGQCGNYGCGTVYELAPGINGKWKETIIRDSSNKDGSPWGPLIFDASGNLYGTTQGEAFELSSGSGEWTYSVLYSDGAFPGLLMDGAGNLYGDMGPGAYEYYGAIAELSSGSSGWTYIALYSFCSPHGVCPDGFYLPYPPIWDGKGDMFGVTLYGGIGQPTCWISFGCGVIFEMTPKGDGTWTYHVLHRFASSKTDGQTPTSGLVMDTSGNFYGTTGLAGPRRNGEVFKIAYSGGHWKKTLVYGFPDCRNGCGPGGQLAFDKAGNLYGAAGGGNTTCDWGGAYCGMIYKLTPQKNGKWKYSSVYKFHGTDGWGPNGVTLDGKGHIFGTTVNGGTYSFGVAFEIIP